MTSSNPTPSTAATYAEEAKQLRAIWDANAEGRPGQAQFGELFDIGGQSAVANFLNGRSPLSLKAALGFARGLRVRVQDFSPRLAREATAIAQALDELKEYGPAEKAPWLSQLYTAPMVGEIKGDGTGCYRIDHNFGQALVVEFWSGQNAYALRIRGDGFYPRYRSGEFLVVAVEAPALEGCDALIRTTDGQQLLCIWNRVLDDEVQLLPLVPTQSPMTLKLEEIERTERVLGCAPRDALRQNKSPFYKEMLKNHF